jgi:hypothetical protein
MGPSELTELCSCDQIVGAKFVDYLELCLVDMVFSDLAKILFRRTSVRSVDDNPATFVAKLSIIDRQRGGRETKNNSPEKQRFVRS